MRGTWGVPEHRNTAKKINEHRISTRKVDEKLLPSPTVRFEITATPQIEILFTASPHQKNINTATQQILMSPASINQKVGRVIDVSNERAWCCHYLLLLLPIDT